MAGSMYRELHRLSMVLVMVVLVHVRDSSGEKTQEKCSSNICYTVYHSLGSTGVTWDEAKDRCVNKSSALVSISNEETQKTVKELLQQVSTAWTGGTVTNEGRWLTLDGRTFTPGTSSAGQCAKKDFTKNKTYATACNAISKFFCVNATVDGSDGTTWFKAREACVNAGGDLPGFDTPSTKEFRWIGLRKRQWIWRRENNTFVEMIYTNWGSNSYSSNVNHTCVVLSEDGSWSNIRCDAKRPAFICQKPKVKTNPGKSSGLGDTDSNGWSPGFIAGIAVAGFLVLCLIIVGIAAYIWYQRRKKTEKTLQPEPIARDTPSDVPAVSSRIPSNIYMEAEDVRRNKRESSGDETKYEENELYHNFYKNGMNRE